MPNNQSTYNFSFKSSFSFFIIFYLDPSAAAVVVVVVVVVSFLSNPKTDHHSKTGVMILW